MDSEERARRQSLRVIVSESIMVIAVIITVVILAFLVSGYGINSDFEVERQGMLQIYSMPTGASVEVDGEAPWYQRTNTSKVLSAGEHNIKLAREGYDTWEKNVMINEGLLYRIHYPRLFLLEREKEAVFDAENYTFATISPDRKYLLLANNTTEWTLINLENETLRPKTLDVSNLLSPCNVISAEWNNNSDRVLLKTDSNTAEWVLLDISNLASSMNVTRAFAAKFDKLRIFDSSASNLLAVQNGELKKIEVAAKTLSDTLAKNVVNFEFYENEVVFIAKNVNSTEYVYALESNLKSEETAKYYAGILKVGNDTTTPLRPVSDSSARVFLSRFYDERYLTFVDKNNITIYYRNNFAKVLDSEISFAPKKIKLGISGDFIFASNGENAATVDMETLGVYEWKLDAENYGWLDDNMLYDVKDGTLVVYDFDGLNRRELSQNADKNFPATISADKYLYYFSENSLTRERITN